MFFFSNFFVNPVVLYIMKINELINFLMHVENSLRFPERCAHLLILGPRAGRDYNAASMVRMCTAY